MGSSSKLLNILNVLCLINLLVFLQCIGNCQGSRRTRCSSNEVYFNSTGLCYLRESQGPCPPLMSVTKDKLNPALGVCKCKPPSCNGRPAVSLSPEDRCYYIYDQGPCKEGEWLARHEWHIGVPECRTIPCPEEFRLQQQKQSNLEADGGKAFVFPYLGQCHRTSTRAFCPQGQEAYISPRDLSPICVSEGAGCVGPASISQGGSLACEDGTTRSSTGGCAPVADFD